MAMILKFVTKDGTKGYGPPYTKKEEAEFYRRNASGPSLSRAKKRGSPKHRSIRRRQRARARN